MADDEIAVKLAQIRETGKTRRTVATCGTICAGILCFTYGYVQVHTPAWQTIALAVVGLFGASSPIVRILLSVSLKRVKHSESKIFILEEEIKKLKGENDVE